MENVKLIDADGNRYKAVLVGEENGVATLTYQAGGRIETVEATKTESGHYEIKEDDK